MAMMGISSPGTSMNEETDEKGGKTLQIRAHCWGEEPASHDLRDGQTAMCCKPNWVAVLLFGWRLVRVREKRVSKRSNSWMTTTVAEETTTTDVSMREGGRRWFDLLRVGRLTEVVPYSMAEERRREVERGFGPAKAL
jgi:predicted SPOUT superfamily RNA methylase MTH1